MHKKMARTISPRGEGSGWEGGGQDGGGGDVVRMGGGGRGSPAPLDGRVYSFKRT